MRVKNQYCRWNIGNVGEMKLKLLCGWESRNAGEFTYLYIVFNCSWQLMFDRKQKCFVKRNNLVIDDGLYNQKAFHKLKAVFIYPLWLNFCSW